MNKKRFLIYSWEGKKYGILLDEVIEVLEITDMVRTNLEVLKVTQWKGRNLPIIDPIAVFSIGESKLTKESKVIVIEKRHTKFGFLVDGMFGVEEISEEETEKASVNESRFVLRVSEDFKIVEMGHFLDDKMMRTVSSAYQIRIDEIHEVPKAYTEKMSEQEFVLNALRMETMNFLIEANRKKLDEYYLNGLTKIQKMVEKI